MERTRNPAEELGSPRAANEGQEGGDGEDGHVDCLADELATWGMLCRASHPSGLAGTGSARGLGAAGAGHRAAAAQRLAGEAAEAGAHGDRGGMTPTPRSVRVNAKSK